MNTVLLGIGVLLAVAMIGVAWLTIRATRIATAMLAAGLVSLFASVLFLFLAAP